MKPAGWMLRSTEEQVDKLRRQQADLAAALAPPADASPAAAAGAAS